jgi:hypothetical protein
MIMKKLILILTIIFCFNTAYSQTKQFSLEDKDLKDNPQTKVKKNDAIQLPNSNWKDFVTESKQLFNPQYKPQIDTIINTIISDTITNIEAASKCLILSGELPNQAMKDALALGGSITFLNTLVLYSMDYRNGFGPGILFVFATIPVGIYVGINSWIKTYKGNGYLQKAGRFLSNKGKNGIEEIDGKYYYIKYASK